MNNFRLVLLLLQKEILKMNLKKHLACLEIWDKGDLRLLFETKIIVMWSADNDLANLKKDFDIDIEFLVDLQSKFAFQTGSHRF